MLEKIKNEQLAKATEFVASYDINQLKNSIGSYYKTNAYLNYALGKMESEGKEIINSRMLARQTKFKKYFDIVKKNNLTISNEAEIMKLCKINRNDCILFCYYLLGKTN